MMSVNASHDGAVGLAYDESIGWGPSDESDQLERMRKEFETLQDAAAALRKRNEKMEAKLSVKHGGYSKRADSLRDNALQKFAELQNVKIETEVFATLRSHEVRGSANRIAKLREEIEKLEEEETVAQKQYGDLLLEKKRIQVKLKV